MDNQRLGIGADFPKISLTDIENKTISIPDDIKTKYCILLFIRGTWWPKWVIVKSGVWV